MPSIHGVPYICRQCLRRLRPSTAAPQRRQITQWLTHPRPHRSRSPSRIPKPRFKSTTSDKPASISPGILSRARANASEHASLVADNEKTFSPTSAKRIGELEPILRAYHAWEFAHTSLAELQSLIADPQADKELRSLAEEDLEETQAAVARTAKELKDAMIPVHAYAHQPCFLEIRPGVGGEEAGLFAGSLVAMYKAYLAQRGFRASVVKYDEQETQSTQSLMPAIREAIIEVSDEGAFGFLRCETGVHRVQRVPETESQGRVHTSVVSVVVLPSLATETQNASESNIDDPSSEFYVNPRDVRIDTMRAQGAGGQHVNKTESAVRLVHEPTNTVVEVSTSRNQLTNRKTAWQVLRARLAQKRREERESILMQVRLGATGGKALSGSRSEKIRTYNYSQRRVTDHRSGMSIYQLDDVLEGGSHLHDLMESARAWQAELDAEIFIQDAEMELERKEKNT